jgi:tripartite-type tricarboxylate transporter receptor subunit TctC
MRTDPASGGECHRSTSGITGRRVRTARITGTAAVAALALGLTACASSGGGGGSTSQSGISYFAGKKVTIIAPDAVGGSLNTLAEIVAPVIASYLHTNVAVENIAAGDTIAGQSALEGAAPNGLTIGILDIGSYEAAILGGQKATPSNPAMLDMLGSPPPGTNAFVVQNNSPFKDFDDIVNATSPVSMLLLAGTGGAEAQTILQAFNVNVHFITGYANAHDVVAGFLRGDGQLTNSNLLNMGQIVDSGKGKAVLVTGPVPANDKKFDGVQTLDAFAAANPISDPKGAAELKDAEAAFFSVGASLAAPQGVPAGPLATLRAAVKSALTNPKVVSQLGAQGLPSGYIDPANATKESLAAESAYKALQADGIKLAK